MRHVKPTPLPVGTPVVTIGLVRAEPHNIFNGTRAVILQASVLSNGRGRGYTVKYRVIVDDPTASSDMQEAWIYADSVAAIGGGK